MNREVLRQVRIRGGLSMADVANELGCDQSSIHCYEVAKRQPSAEIVEQWAKAIYRLLNGRRERIESALSALEEEPTN